MFRPRVLLAIVSMAVLFLVTSQGSEAHSRPIRFTPEPGGLLSAAPASVQGWFTSDIRNVSDSFIQVFDSSKNRVDTGSIGLSKDRRQMSINLKPGLGEGSYLVYWSTHDDVDNEVFAGCYVFFVGQSAADKAIAAGAPMDGGANCPANPNEDTGASVAVKVNVSGSDATVQITPVNFEPRSPDGTSHEAGKGHYHIYLDKIPTDALTGEGHSHDTGAADTNHDSGGMAGMDMGSGDASDDPNGLVENPVMWNTNSYSFKNLKPGVHTVAVALNYDDHTPYSPPVLASANFVIAGDGGGVETWMFIAGLGVALAGGLAVGRVLGKV